METALKIVSCDCVHSLDDILMPRLGHLLSK